MSKRRDLEVLKMELQFDGSITVSNRKGYALDVHPVGPMKEQCDFMRQKYFEAVDGSGTQVVWMVGKFYAAAGSSQKTKLMLVRRADDKDQVW